MVMMALTPKRLFLYLCISISLLRPYSLFSRSPLVNKTFLFESFSHNRKGNLLNIWRVCSSSVMCRYFSFVYFNSSKVLRADGRLVNMPGVFCTNNAQAPSLFSNVTLTSRRSYVETVSGNSALLQSNGILEGHCCPKLFQHTIVCLLVLRWKRGGSLCIVCTKNSRHVFQFNFIKRQNCYLTAVS